MFCTQCGCKIEDGFKFCPGCGANMMRKEQSDSSKLNADGSHKKYSYCPNIEPNRKMSQEEVEKLVDDIFWRDPRFTWSNVVNVQKRTGLDKNTAKRMIDERIKEVKRGVDKRVCPSCGSRDIVVHRGSNSTTMLSFSEGIYHTQYNSGKIQGECLECGNKWKIKLV